MKRHVLIIEPISSGDGLPKAAKELNCHVTALALNTGFVKISPECLSNIDTLIEMNVSDERELEQTIMNVNEKHPIDAILSGFEYFVPHANRIAAKLGLPSNRLDWVEATRYKHLMYENFSQFHLPCPKTYIVHQAAEAYEAASIVGFPCIIKPSDGIGSSNVYKVWNAEELDEKLSIIQNRPLEEDWQFAMSQTVLIQEFIDGEEISVETIVRNGEITFQNVTDKIVTNGPCFVELGHLVPSKKDPLIIDRILTVTRLLHQSLGIRFGATHVEMRIVNGQPIVIEVAARLPGGNIPSIIQQSKGIDLWKETVASYLDLPMEYTPDHPKGVCIRFLTTEKAGSFQIEGVDRIKDRPHLLKYSVKTCPFETSGRIENYADRYGYVITSGKDAEEALAEAEFCISHLKWVEFVKSGAVENESE
ncbi:ATP-grasp domain-containing protein [Brevibacillus ruminantium]|uniref:ATP-grasp domain-containing protein n=1 Tax=Brevibacillus ruminantium TaxID=2950604 RepID=A0ABY4WBQ0_9BACL|nr:ATP-grasp domain-containing protein [Brevibacillus ruminantium]USG64603.1 ATP-grasp domain-containing protein [Brevibacillus ruminantium]